MATHHFDMVGRVGQTCVLYRKDNGEHAELWLQREDDLQDQLNASPIQGWVLVSLDDNEERVDGEGGEWKELDLVVAKRPLPPPSSSNATFRRRKSSTGGGSSSSSAPVELDPPVSDCSLKVDISPAFNLLKNSIGREWTHAQAVKELLANSLQSLMMLLLKQPPVPYNHKKASLPRHWVPHIHIVMDAGLKKLRVLDNGHGLELPSLKAWARLGQSKNTEALQDALGQMCSADKKFVKGPFGYMCSAFGVGGKGGAVILTEDEAGTVHGVVTMMCQRKATGRMLALPLDLKRMQEAQSGETWTQFIEAKGADSPVVTELRALIEQQQGWGERFTCVEVTNLTDKAVAELQRCLIPDLISNFRYVLNPALFDRLGLGQRDVIGPKEVSISVEIIEPNGRRTHHQLNELCHDGDDNLPAQLSVQRAIVRSMNAQLQPFVLPIPLQVDGMAAPVMAHLFLEYYPMNNGAQSLPKGAMPGFDTLWQGHLLSNESRRHIAFMRNDSRDSKLNSKFWRSTLGRELSALLDVCGDRIYGELLLPPELTVTKNKTQLQRNPESANEGTRLVEALYTLEIKPGGAVTPEDAARFKQFVEHGRKHDEEVRFVYESGDTEPAANVKRGESGFITKILRFKDKDFNAPTTTAVGVTNQRTTMLRMKVKKDLKKDDAPGNIIWAEVLGFRFTREDHLAVSQVRDACNHATDGEVFFCPWTHERGAVESRPIAHLIKEIVLERSWEGHVEAAKRFLKEKQPRTIEIMSSEPGYNLLTVLGDRKTAPLSLEQAFRSCAFAYLCVGVKNEKNKLLSSTDFKGFVLTLRAWQPRANATATGADPSYTITVKADQFREGKVWLTPWPMNKPGDWKVKLTVEYAPRGGAAGSSTDVGGGGQVETCSDVSFIVPVLPAAIVHRLEVKELNEEVMLGTPLPPLTLTAFDITNEPFALAAPFPAVAVRRPAVSTVDISSRGVWSLSGRGELVLTGLVLEGSLGTNKASNSVNVVFTLPGSQKSANLMCTLTSGTPTILELSEPALSQSGTLGTFACDRAPAASAQNRSKASSFLPPMKLRGNDKWGNPVRLADVTLAVEPENAIEHPKGPTGSDDNRFKLENGVCKLAKDWMKVHREGVREEDRACTLTFAIPGAPDATLTLPFTIKGMPKHVTAVTLSVRGGSTKVGFGEPTVIELRSFAGDEEARVNMDKYGVYGLTSLTVTREGSGSGASHGGASSSGAAAVGAGGGAGSGGNSGGGGGCTIAGGWERCDDGLGVWATATLAEAPGKLSLSVTPQVGGSAELCSLLAAPLKLEVLPGAPAHVKVAIAQPLRIVNGNQISLPVSLVDLNGVDATMPPGTAAKVEWEVLPSDGSSADIALRPVGRKLTAAKGTLIFEILTKRPLCAPPHPAHLAASLTASLIIKATLPGAPAGAPGPLLVPTDAVRVQLMPGRAPARILVGKIAPVEPPAPGVDEMEGDDEDEEQELVTEYTPSGPHGVLETERLVIGGAGGGGARPPIAGRDSQLARRLAMRVQLEDGTLLPPGPCFLKVSLTQREDATAYVLDDRADGHAAASQLQPLAKDQALRTTGVKRYADGGAAGGGSMIQGTAIILDGDVPQPTAPGSYALRFSLTYGGSRLLPSKELLAAAGRESLAETLPIDVVTGPPHRLQPFSAEPLEYVAGTALTGTGGGLLELAYLCDAGGNRIACSEEMAVSLKLRPSAGGSSSSAAAGSGAEDEGDEEEEQVGGGGSGRGTPTRGQPVKMVAPSVRMALDPDGRLVVPRIELESGDDAPSGLYRLGFTLDSTPDVSGSLEIRFVNPLQRQRDEEQRVEQRRKLAKLEQSYKEATKKDMERSKEVKAAVSKLTAATKAADAAEAAKRDVKRRLDQISGEVDGGLDGPAIKRIRTEVGLGESKGELRPPTADGSAEAECEASTTAEGKQLQDQVLSLPGKTVRVLSADGQEHLTLTLDDFRAAAPGTPPFYECGDRDDNGAIVRYELRPLVGPNGTCDCNNYAVHRLKIVRGQEEACGPVDGQTLPTLQKEEETLLAAMHGQTLMECGRVADPRVGGAIVALLGGKEFAVMKQPSSAGPIDAATVNAVVDATKTLRLHFPEMGVLLPQSLPADWLVVASGPARGLLSFGDELHPSAIPPDLHASYLVNRICCDDGDVGTAQRLAWARALRNTVCFKTEADLLRWRMRATDAELRTYPALVALNSPSAGPGNFAVVRDGARLENVQAVGGTQGCALAGISCAGDEEQALAGTREGLLVLHARAACDELAEKESALEQARANVQALEQQVQACNSAKKKAADVATTLKVEVDDLKRKLGVAPGSRTAAQGSKRQRRM